MWIDTGAFLSPGSPLNMYPEVVSNESPCIGVIGKFFPVVVVGVVDTLLRSCFRLCKWDGCFCMSLLSDTTVACFSLLISDDVFPSVSLSVVTTGELSNQSKVLSRHFINPFLPNVPFHTPWKRQETKCFLTFSGGMEMKHWANMG